MSHIDDLFRDGLSGRKADIPNTNDLWARINAAKKAPLSEGEALDQTFRSKLQDRTAPVPAGMWSRIVAARVRRPLAKWLLAATALLLLVLVVSLNLMRQSGESPSPAPTTTATPVTNATAAAPLAPSPVKAEEVTGATNTDAPTNAGFPTTSAVPATIADNSGSPLSPAPTEAIPPLAPTNVTTPAPPAVNRNVNASRVVDQLAVPPATLRLPKTALPALYPVPDDQFRKSGSPGIQTELLFGISYARQEFSLQDPAAAPLRDLRQASEFPEFGYQITLRGTYQFNERLRVLAGLTYAEIRNELEYDRFTNGTTTLIRTNNNIRMLEAPVLLGFSVPGRRVNVTINAGPVVNLTTSVRGRFLHPDFGPPQDLATNGNFRNNIGVGFMSSLSTTYQIGKKHPFTLLVEPFFKAYPTAFTVKAAPLREKYWVAGLQLGVRKTLR